MSPATKALARYRSMRDFERSPNCRVCVLAAENAVIG
jgi:hypothetical protein